MDTNIALAGLASGMAVSIGAAYGRGVHDAPPGCAWKHCHEKYVWTPVCLTTSPLHGLVQSYLCSYRATVLKAPYRSVGAECQGVRAGAASRRHNDIDSDVVRTYHKGYRTDFRHHIAATIKDQLSRIRIKEL